METHRIMCTWAAEHAGRRRETEFGGCLNCQQESLTVSRAGFAQFLGRPGVCCYPQQIILYWSKYELSASVRRSEFAVLFPPVFSKKNGGRVSHNFVVELFEGLPLDSA